MKKPSNMVLLIFIIFSLITSAYSPIKSIEDITGEKAYFEFPIPDSKSSPVIAGKYVFNNPAGCADTAPQSINSMLSKVESMLGPGTNLKAKRNNYVWNGPKGEFTNVTIDPYIAEFQFDTLKYPTTYLGDKAVTAFLVSGFTAWVRNYNGHAYITAVPMISGVMNSPWKSYVEKYWESQAAIPADKYIFKTVKKLPCKWAMDAGFVSNDQLKNIFDFNYNIPDYVAQGEKYLAGTCKDTYKMSIESLGHPDASTICGPLSWNISKNSNGLPYRIDSLHDSDISFLQAYPRSNGFPWLAFDPETSTINRVKLPMPGYDFQNKGNLYPGDIVFSYVKLYSNRNSQDDKQIFSHIFVVAGVRSDGSRIAISNMLQNWPQRDCFIREIVLYTPGDLLNGVINHEWNGGGFGKTGQLGFDIMRWNWETYHINAVPIRYTVRLGDTWETIGFDWKVSPQAIASSNDLSVNSALTPGQKITLPGIKSN